MAGKLAAALAQARAALSLARELADAEAESSAETVIAELTAELGNVSEAEEMALAGTAAAEPATRARAYRCLGHAQRRLHRLATAEADLARGRQLAQQAGDHGEEVRLIMQLAVVAAMLGDAAAAEARCDEAELVCRDRGPAGSSQLALIRLGQGRTRSLGGDLDGAREALQEGWNIASAADQPLRCAHLQYYLAEVLLKQSARAATGAAELRAEAEQRAAQALRDFAGMRHGYGVARCRKMLGRIAFYDGRIFEAAQLLQDALETFQGCGDPLVEGKALRDLARCYRQQGDNDQAARLTARAEEIFAELNYSDESTGPMPAAADGPAPAQPRGARVRGRGAAKDR
jgi:tetratricopeptide (TPR) repeat protein